MDLENGFSTPVFLIWRSGAATIVFHGWHHHNLGHKQSHIILIVPELCMCPIGWLCLSYRATMSSPELSTWSATEPMSLSMTSQIVDLSPLTMKRIPSAARRYYTQPRIGNYFRPAISSTNQASISLAGRDGLVRKSAAANNGCGKQNGGKGEGTSNKQPTRRKPAKPRSGASLSLVTNTPTRQSSRLISQRAASLEKILRQRLVRNISPVRIRSRKTPRRLGVDLMTEPLPALSDDPACYLSNTEDCRFHIPITVEDRLAIGAALTPTLFRLQKKGWRGNVVWNPDASYMEAHQKCLEEYYRCELMKDPNLSPFDLPTMLTLLPWYGNISNFRSSPNWPKGW